jgi:hypothetical protein
VKRYPKCTIFLFLVYFYSWMALMVDFLFIDTSKVWTTAAGIERGSAQGGGLWLTRGEEATLGATAAR